MVSAASEMEPYYAKNAIFIYPFGVIGLFRYSRLGYHHLRRTNNEISRCHLVKTK